MFLSIIFQYNTFGRGKLWPTTSEKKCQTRKRRIRSFLSISLSNTLYLHVWRSICERSEPMCMGYELWLNWDNEIYFELQGGSRGGTIWIYIVRWHLTIPKSYCTLESVHRRKAKNALNLDTVPSGYLFKRRVCTGPVESAYHLYSPQEGYLILKRKMYRVPSQGDPPLKSILPQAWQPWIWV